MANGNNRQVKFSEKQTHVRGFELAMIGISVVCAVIVLIIVLGTDMGNEFRPQL